MPSSKLTTALAAELIAERVNLPKKVVRLVLDAFDELADRALQGGHEVEIGSLGYLGLREPKQVAPPKGAITRGKRAAFREKDANRHRWK